MLDGISITLAPTLVRRGPVNQAVQIVAVGTVRAESLFVEQAFDAAAQADLVGMLLQGDRPAHLAVPAAAKNHQSGPSHPCGHQTKRCPTRLLFLVTHLPQPVTHLKSLTYFKFLA